MIKSILLPIDGSNYSETVLKYGMYMSKKFDAVVRVLSVVDIRLIDWSMATGAESFVPLMPSADFQAESQKMQEEKAEKVNKKAEGILKKSGIKHEIIKSSGIPADEICHYAMENDFVIMGIRGEYEKWTNKFLGATVESVTRQINKPTMLVDKDFHEIERVHCGYDSSSYANKALQLSAYIVSTLKINLQVIAISVSDEERQQMLNEADRYLNPYEIEYNLRHETGDPSETLVNVQNNAPAPSLMVIGSYGHTRLREAIIGSTTVEVMRKAQKPVLLAK
jgi:nucleotide-binding universal stress UspA family protein